MNPKADVLLITVTKVESQAVMQVFKQVTGKDPRPVPIGDRIFHNLGEINGATVFMALSEMGSGGLGGSQETVRKGIEALKPTSVIMVGIAFGINEQKQTIGDILVSKQLWLYDLQRIGADRIIPRGDKPHASTRLINFFQGADLYWNEAKVHFGLILTGEKLVDNIDYRDQLKQFEQEAVGGEMEGAGLYVTCQDKKTDWILIKAICDWADGQKSQDKNQRQQLAAHNAARFVLYVLQLGGFDNVYDKTSAGTTDHEPSQRINDLSLKNITQACAKQVSTEIAVTVGTKYIPDLYINRDAQATEIERALSPEDKFKSLIQVEVENAIHKSELPQEACAEILKASTRSEFRQAVMHLLSVLQSLDNLEKFKTLQKYAEAYLETWNGRLHVIVSHAGTGKTNLMCHLATQYAQRQPVIFLSGRSGIDSRTTIRELIEFKLGKYLDASPREKLFDDLVETIDHKDSKLLVFIDAINEHRDLEVLSIAIAEFLLEIKKKPILVIVSCRAVYWPFIDTSNWLKAQWSLLDLRLVSFSPGEFNRAQLTYFAHYKIRATLSKEAQEKLSHPLILRFFCETYGNPSNPDWYNLKDVPDIRLKALFEGYLKRKLTSIRQTAPRRPRTTIELEDFLLSLAERMYKTRSREVHRNDIRRITRQTDLESPESIYTAILGEDIILEERPDANSGDINVLFTFDEFMEYMIARALLHEHEEAVNNADIQFFVQVCSDYKRFPSFVGVFEYVFLILRENHSVTLRNVVSIESTELQNALIRAIGKLKPDLVGEDEIQFLTQGISTAVSKRTQQLDNGLKQPAIITLMTIIEGSQYQRHTRERGVNAIRLTLEVDDDPWTRYEIIKFLDNAELTLLGDSVRLIIDWWRTKQDEAKQKYLIFSDDDIGISNMYSIKFKSIGFRNLAIGATGSSTIKLAKEKKPALIVTDLRKPDMSGIEMAFRFSQTPELSDIPILVCSASADEIMTPYSKLILGVIKKPVNLNELVGIVQIILAGKMK